MHKLTDRHIYAQTNRQTDRYRYAQTNRQTDRHRYAQTDRQADIPKVCGTPSIQNDLLFKHSLLSISPSPSPPSYLPSPLALPPSSGPGGSLLNFLLDDETQIASCTRRRKCPLRRMEGRRQCGAGK